MSNLPWCVIGVFNDLLSQQDKRGRYPHPKWLCTSFQQVVSDCDLSDILLEGYQFTWVKSRGTEQMIEDRLDTTLANSDWISNFPNPKLTNLIVSHSDHSPIILFCESVQHMSKRYGHICGLQWLE